MQMHCTAGTLPAACDGDAFLLRQILHDWSDKDVIKILSSCREAMGAHKSKLLIVEVSFCVADSASNQIFNINISLWLAVTCRYRSWPQMLPDCT